MKHSMKILIVSIAIFIAVGCGGSSDPGELKVEKLKGGELIANVPANLLKKTLIEEQNLSKDTTVYGYKAYKIPYTTTDEQNNSVQASGIMVVPTDYNADEETAQKIKAISKVGFAMVVNCHGTVFSNKEVPSVEVESSMAPEDVGVLFSSIAGFVTLQPDYIGYGDSSKHYHPYLLEKSSANSVVDFTKAAIKFAKDNNISLVASKDIYLTGYSQGGYVALAAQELFEKKGYNLKLTMPMDGPYLLDPIAQGVLSQNMLPVPSFMAAVAYSYAKTYSNIDIKDLIQDPFANELDSLYDGSLNRLEIDKKLTHKTKGKNGLFTDTIANNYVGSNFQLALQQNSVVDFQANTPIRLVHCKTDGVVPYRVAEGAKEIFSTYFNTIVDLIAVENLLPPKDNIPYNHGTCASPAYKITAGTFAQMRALTIGY